MKKRRKHKACLNCGELLQQKNNYCPNCGQENTDNQVSISLLLREFLSNFFSLDSRFGRTFKPFLFSPGKLTIAFNEGRRVLYANPIRWYLVISIFHFFFLAKILEPTAKDKKLRGFMDEMESLSDTQYDSIFNYPDSSSNADWPLSNNKMKLIRHLNQEVALTPDQIMDTLRLDSLPFFRRFASKQIIKINQETNATLSSYILRQIPIIVFCILPLYALLLKLFFWKKGLYIKHLIHSIHIHSLLFFLLGFVWVISLFIDGFKDYGDDIAVLITSVYIVISFKRVYAQKLIWCITKFFMIGFIYSILLGISLLLGVLVSLAML
ncbi:DUF3667 domain-containing protein [Ekhidna sp.]|uniref:DUF3667 domain-containing protein n=1 Tax=Ekhidna sp. TaxID=2608089 RepID=UPI003B505FC1